MKLLLVVSVVASMSEFVVTSLVILDSLIIASVDFVLIVTISLKLLSVVRIAGSIFEFVVNSLVILASPIATVVMFSSEIKIKYIKIKNINNIKPITYNQTHIYYVCFLHYPISSHICNKNLP